MDDCRDSFWSFANHRLHEVSGPAREVFALHVALGLPGHLLIIGSDRDITTLCPHGLIGLDATDRILSARVPAETDLFWTAEAGLRSSSLGSIIAFSRRGADLTKGRRLQLACEAGNTAAFLCSEYPQSTSAAETRWHVEFAPAEGFDSPRLICSLYKNKRGTTGEYIATLDQQTGAIHLVSKASA